MSEKISNLFDNQTDKADLDKDIDKLSSNHKLKKEWSNYQIVRDVMQNNYSHTPNLTEKIMASIDKEPTQISGYVEKNGNNNSLTFSFKQWKIAASFAALFVVGVTTVNLSPLQNNGSIQLVQEDVSNEIISKHYANTSHNASYFIQANFAQQD